MTTWHLFIYRLPLQPSRARVGVWRALRRLGSLPLGQSILAVPDLGDLSERLDAVESRIADEDGVCWRFTLSDLPPTMEQRLQSEWNALRTQEFAEIVEECETKFQREIEFEIFRGNLTAAEAEEIEADLDKIKAWFDRVCLRDWFGAPGREETDLEIQRVEALYNDFAERVYLAETQDGHSTSLPIDLPWGTTGDDGPPATITALPARPRKTPQAKPARKSKRKEEGGTA